MSSSPKTILITGGASGIGLGMTHHFASQSTSATPINLFILDVNTNEFSPLSSTLQTTYPTAKFNFLNCDVSSWQSVASCFSQIYAQTQRIDIVMANAGISKEGALIDPDPQQDPVKPSLSTIDVNLTGCIYTVKLAIHYMRRNPLSALSNSINNTNSSTSIIDANTPNGQTPTGQSRGQIIITASNAGIYAFPVAPIYAATKAGVINLTRSLALPLTQKEIHIQINALAPAVLETNIAPDRSLFKTMRLTPMSTLCKAVDLLLDGRSGEVVEVHGDSVSVREAYGWVDEDSEWNLGEFWRLGYA